AEDGIRDYKVTGVQTCALPISGSAGGWQPRSSDRPSIRPDVLAGDPPGVVGAEHRHHVRDVLRLPQPPQRRHLGEPLLLLLALRSEERRVGKECMLWGGAGG